MRWMLIAGGVVVAVVLIVVVIGALLPRDHVATATRRIAAAPAVVWRAISEPGRYAEWRPDVQRVELLEPGAHGPSWREHSKNGVIRFATDALDTPRRMVTRIADDGLPFGGTWEYRVEPDGENATLVTITERGSVYNPLFRFVSRFVMGHTATIDAYLRALDLRCARTSSSNANAEVSSGL